MPSYRSFATAAVVAPGPDDSDFLDSESEREANDSLVERDVSGSGYTIPSASQSSRRAHPMTDMEAELAAVATPCASQTSTSTSYFSRQQHPTPAFRIMQMTSNFSFTYFDKQSPQPDLLNRANGREAAGLSLNSVSSRAAPSSSSKEEIAPSSIAPHLAANAIVHWFSIDNELVYLSFFDDWGPLNVAMFYRFCLHLHHLIGMMQERAASAVGAGDETPDVHLVLYTTNQPRAKANAALLAAMYAMVCGDMTPADAYHPISELELVPFRDAGYGRADFYLTVQDILYGVHRAVTEKLLDLIAFDLDEYETYEQVQNGDWNWITPNIIAFASPNDKEYVAELRAGGVANGRATPGLRRPLNPTFTKTIRYFKEKNVKLVVRLNNPLYDARVFEREGIAHVDMYFDDGSNPSDDIIRDFIERASEVISTGGAIAVHCKAGLGRTGVLIGAYLAYKHGFSASESIGFMRIMRPGCVVGPQQHFMYQQSSTWIRWREQDDAKKVLEDALEVQRRELLGSRRRKSDELEANSSNEESYTDLEVDAALGNGERRIKKLRRVVEEPRTPKKSAGDEEKSGGHATQALLAKPTPCVGQPRKSPSPSRKRAAQAQAPATVARMGGLGTSSRGRLHSADHRSLSGSTFAQALHQADQVREVEEQRGNTRQPQQHGPVTPSGSRVLGNARRINIQAVADEGEVALSTARVDDWNATNEAKASLANKARSHGRSNSANRVAEDTLFVEGWKSPEPAAVYMERLSQSPSRPLPASNAPLVAPSTPTSPATPTQGVRASPLVREKFGLREAGSHQGTPRSRKEAGGIASSESNGSSSSASLTGKDATGSLTSRDASGSEEEQLHAGPLEHARSIASVKPLNVLPSSAKTHAPPSRQASHTAGSRVLSRERTMVTSTTTKTRTVSSSSSTSQRTISASRPASSAARRVVQSKQPTAMGRVAAARDQLAQKHAAQQASVELAQRSNLKRARVQSPDMAASSEGTMATRTVVPAHVASKFGLGISTAAVAQPKPSAVPRFASATAASVAKSQHTITEQAPRFQRGGPLHTVSTKTFQGPVAVGPAASSAAMVARLNGRNVRRRRSSIS